MGPHEPYWRTNTSFSPPPPQWNFRFHSEPPSFHSHDSNHLYTPSTSSNSRESRNWFRPNSNHFPTHHHSNSDGIGIGIGIPFLSTPSDLSPNQQWTPPTIQEINLHEYTNSEGLNEERASISSHSDSSDFETIVKSLSRRCFKSKPVHPLAIPVERTNSGIHDSDSDVAESVESESVNRGDKCGLCERFLSQRSPWGPRQIIRSGDFPVTGVLPCRHVFHAECLDQNTPKVQKVDPPCPICVKSESSKSSSEIRVLSKLKNGPSRQWGCVQAGNCVEGALSGPSHNGVLVINRNRIKKGSSGKEVAGKLKKSGGGGGGGGGDGVGCSRKKS